MVDFPPKLFRNSTEYTYAKLTILKVSVDIIACNDRITKHAVFNLDIIWSI